MTTEQHDLKTLAVELINSQSTMALATAAGGEAWAAPVYYVFYRGVFYFFSAPDSRHIQEGTANKQASATIYPFVTSWKEIRGIQMSGSIRKVKPGITAIKAVRAYVDKYPFTREFFDPGQDLDLENFGNKFRVRLYRFDPHFVYYLDNRIKFGFRDTIEL
jgi:uncharacterized protein